MSKDSKVSYFDNSLTKLQSELETIGKLRFQKLDQFMRDCKTANEQLKRFGVPDVDWVFVDDADESKKTYCLGYHKDTLVWKDWEDAVDLAEGLPLYEASAEVRAGILEDGLLKYLMQDAILELHDLKDLDDLESTVKSKGLNSK